MKTIEASSGSAVTVFIPSSPMPATGYTITVPRKDIIDMPISVEEAMRFTISAGVLVPTSQELEQLDYDKSSSKSTDSGSEAENIPEGRDNS